MTTASQLSRVFSRNGIPEVKQEEWAEVTWINPTRAKEILDTLNTKNRDFKPKKIAEMSEAMKNGTFGLNGASIAFYVDGTLADGQNRLQACVDANVPFKTLVVHNIAEECRHTIDSGTKRSTVDNLVMDGEINATDLSGAINLCISYDNGWIKSRRAVAPTMASAFLVTDPDIRDHVAYLKTLSIPNGLRVTRSQLAFLLKRASDLGDEAVCKAFIRQLLDGAGYELGSGPWHMRYFLDDSRYSQRNRSLSVHALIISYNVFALGKLRSRPLGEKSMLGSFNKGTDTAKMVQATPAVNRKYTK